MRQVAIDRRVILASSDVAWRAHLGIALTSMHWQVCEANGGAEAMACLEEMPAEALLVDDWLPDLEVSAFTKMVRQAYPSLELLRRDGYVEKGVARSQFRHELLQAIREVAKPIGVGTLPPFTSGDKGWGNGIGNQNSGSTLDKAQNRPPLQADTGPVSNGSAQFMDIPGLVGQGRAMLELFRLIRLVAPHSARVLIEGETGTGKELVAKALHTLSSRSKKPLVVLNCAAIPEALLEAELFGHTRGAFTGAVQSRMGRIEAAHGGTLFLDEIGEMPLLLQAKLLRFLENGELQRIGDNDAVRVDVRVVAATHQNLDQCVEERTFRLDLLHRLAVFPIEVPRLRDRLEDIPLLAEHFLSEFAKEMPRKRLGADALQRLCAHTWPGNVRELGHVLQRATILSDSRAEITAAEILVRRTERR